MTIRKRSSRELRALFLDYFRRQGHEVLPSSPVVPRGDATLLFANAGMVQFKDVFLGTDVRSYKRAATSQKCIRMSGKHNDLENVGQTARHHTFFEMLGNFSFGDYFKRDAIRFAWEFLTGVLEIPKERLVITVFGGEDGLPADDEARALWKEVTGFGDERILGLGKKDNFWTMGDTGPCGPCTEIHYAMGDIEPDPKTFHQEPRYDGTGWFEVWNLVFMQFDRDAKGVLSPLPAPCVDTGMGLERLSAVCQGVTSNYDTDLLRPLVDLAAKLSGKTYTASDKDDDVSMRVLADHARMTALCLSEGVVPGPKERPSALRSVMRRAVRHGVRLGIEDSFLDKLVLAVVEQLGDVYPQLHEKKDFMAQQARLEEERFRRTIKTGLEMIEAWCAKNPSGPEREMSGADAFDLYSTYGFPFDLTEVLGREKGFKVDETGFGAAKMHFSVVSRGKGGSIAKGVDAKYKEARLRLGAPVEFTGYDAEKGESEVALLLEDGDFVDVVGTGDECSIVTRATPFYGESGGQVGDQGVLRSGAALFRVTDTLKPVEGLFVHVGVVEEGPFTVGQKVTLEVDHALRSATRRNHSATHLLHWALRKVLGAHVQQRGSKVGPDTLRFDYAAERPTTHEELRAVEDLVNAEVLGNTAVSTEVTSQEQARSSGAMMIFEENYGDVVRMLRIGTESVELCGGTHVRQTGDIGLFKVVSDEALGAGVRRVSAATGLNALAYLREVDDRNRRAAGLLKASPAEVPARVVRLLEEQRDLQKQVAELQRKLALGGSGGDPTAKARAVGDVKWLAFWAPVGERGAVRELAEQLRDKLGKAVVFVSGANEQGKATSVCFVSKEATATVNAGQVMQYVCAAVGGRGGGKRADLAEGGGFEEARWAEAEAALYRFAEEGPKK